MPTLHTEQKKQKQSLSRNLVGLAVISALTGSHLAHAQSAEDVQGVEEEEVGFLEQIVVTGVSRGQRKN